VLTALKYYVLGLFSFFLSFPAPRHTNLVPTPLRSLSYGLSLKLFTTLQFGLHK